MPLDATVGGVSANSYVTRAEALAYLGDKIGAETFVEEVDEEKLDRALITATRYLDRRVVWTGDKATTTQALKWPRLDLDGEPIVAADTIPTEIKEATYELAQFLYSNGDPLESAALDSVRISSLEIDFREDTSESELIPDDVMSIIAEYGQRRSTKGTIREVALIR